MKRNSKMPGILLFGFIIQLIANIFPDAVIQIRLTTDANIADSVQEMKGKCIRALAVHYPPTFVIEKLPDGSSVYSGPSYESLMTIASVLQLTIEFIEKSDEDLKSKKGISPLQTQTLMDDEVDIAPIGLVASPLQYKQLDVSVPKMFEPYILIVPWPKEESRLLASIRPFQPMVWLWLGVAILVLTPFLSFLSGFYTRYIAYSVGNPIRNRSIIKFADILHNGSFLLSHITNQGFHYNLRFRSRGSFIAVGVWCLMAVVLANAYGGVLFSFLSVAKLEPVINSLDELTKSKDVQLITLRGVYLTNRFLNATNGAEKLIGDSLRANPDNLVPNPIEAKAKLMTGSYAFTFFKLYTFGLINSTYSENGKKCLLTIAKEPASVFSSRVGMGLQKNGPFTQAINEQIQAQIETGINSFYYNKATPNVDQCKMENQKASSRQKALSLMDMSTAFVLLGIGISLSILVFILELILKRIKDHYFNK